jgi:hypothetical protein
LVLLTLVVIAYTFQFFSIPRSVYLNAQSLNDKQAVEIRLTLPTTGFPHEYKDVTEDSDFRWGFLTTYMHQTLFANQLRILDTGGKAAWWLTHAPCASQGYNVTLRFFNESYFMQVRYLPEFHRTSLEKMILWTIDGAALFTWGVFILKRLQRV